MDILVSILTPCYNGAKYIDRYAKSLLAQDYSNCQLIFMDDGSTDNSKELIMSYEKQFKDRGFSFEYYYHDNLGLGATIAEGIKYVKGSYLVWPDVDDTLPVDSISKKVFYLEQKAEYGLVRTRFMKIIEGTGFNHSEIGPSFKFDPNKENLFEDYLLSRGAWLQPGCFMVRMSAFDDANPNRYIFPTRRGQDWQMLLPIMYKYKCGFIDEPLYEYYIRKGSMSDQTNDILETVLHRYDMYEELITETVKHMNISNCSMYIQMVHNHYLEEKLGRSFDYCDKNKAKIFFNELRKNKAVTPKALVKYLLVQTPFLNNVINKLRSR